MLFVACDKDAEPDIIAVTDVALNKDKLFLEEGEAGTLSVIITPSDATNQKVIWTSSDTNVATVDANGLVTALKTGTVTIIVVTQDGAKIATCSVICGDDIVEPEVPVVDITLNKRTLTLKEGESDVLEAIITPDNATNKKVIWISNDTDKVMVDANGKVTALKSGSATITAVTEDGVSATCTVTVEPEALLKGRRTVLVYIAADNNLKSLVSQDLEEMRRGMAKVQNADVHLLVYIDDGSSARLIELKNEKGTVAETVVRTYGKRNSVGVSETKEVFVDAFSTYQADSYGLVYWSHGDGWLPYPLSASTRWVGQDKSNGDNRMNISEFVEILKSAPHFDFILFDACFMQSVEVAYELRDYTDYCIGSPTEIPGPGASYDEVVPAMFSTENATVRVARAYYEPYAAKYNAGKDISNTNWTGGVSVCALKTDQLVELAAITKQVLPENLDKALLRASVFDYDKRSPYEGHVGYYDLVGMIRAITDESVYKIWKKSFDATVVYWNTTQKNYSSYVDMFSMEDTEGVSCYILSASDNLTDKAYRSIEWYTAAGLGEFHW